ncbi:FkbM family methyltransferase [Phenylobacterium sp.]|jgi:FkbM family methyltransferase|uniref:FkbM family methyltransferase n=1 Tax=Phenylobacterium sp. TaxID=1871053 RepID=UPI0025F70BB1|nr:FkbM family methyltransferase [Phenylobacterium sp.]MCA3747270.1 FkbM family methyltransferase [Phenylobacterium sp.]
MVAISRADFLLLMVGLRDSDPARDEQIAFLQFCMDNAAWSHGQFLQDLWVAYETKMRHGGFFVEFGATDGIKFSNTRALETRLGWSGILAEPARIWYPALRRNRACFIDDRCVWTRTGETLTFNQPAIAAHSTIDAYSQGDSLADTRAEGQRYEVTTVSLNDLLAHWRAPRRIDYLSIDTEGSELDILQALDFDAWEIRLITVEHNHTSKRQEIHDFLASKGYRRKFETLSNVDDWYVRTY